MSFSLIYLNSSSLYHLSSDVIDCLMVEPLDHSPHDSGVGSSISHGLITSCHGHGSISRHGGESSSKTFSRGSGSCVKLNCRQMNIQVTLHSLFSSLKLSYLGLEKLLLIITALNIRAENILVMVKKLWVTWELLDKSKN